MVLQEEILNLEDFTEEIDKRIYGKVTWNYDDLVIKAQKEKWRKGSNSINSTLDRKIKRSILGHFLYDFNSVQKQEKDIQTDKMNMYKHDESTNINEREKNSLVNDLTDQLDCLINEMINSNKDGTVTRKQLMKRLDILRINGSNVREFKTNRLRRLSNIQFLVLSGNDLTNVHGASVPFNGKYLELYANELSEMSELLDELPHELLYLGLSCNLLTEQTKSLEKYQLKNLLVLDLGDNNINDLNFITELLKNLTPELCGLILQGNPCSYLPNYFSVITSKLKKLKILDNEDIGNYELSNSENKNLIPGMKIYCLRLFGLQQPAPEKYQNKKVNQTFHVEIECPLMDNGLRIWEFDKIQNELHGVQEIHDEDQTIIETKGKDKTSRSGGGSKDKPKSKKQKVVPEKDVHEEILQNILKNDKRLPGISDITSPRMQWSKMIAFPEPAIEIISPNGNLLLLRDTFRSVVIIRIVHLKTIPAEKQKSAKPSSKSKGKEEVKPATPLPPQETVLSREILARIPVTLKSMKWSTDLCFYTWDKMNPYHAEESKNLKDLNYNVSGKGKSKKKTGVTKSTTTPSAASSDQPLSFPEYITCHLGIGVIREKLLGRSIRDHNTELSEN